MFPTPFGSAGRANGPPPSSSMLAALVLLQRARDVALELGLDPGEFAVDIVHLIALGLDGGDIRHLLTAGLAEHRDERVPLQVDGRCWRRAICAVLTAR